MPHASLRAIGVPWWSTWKYVIPNGLRHAHASCATSVPPRWMYMAEPPVLPIPVSAVARSTPSRV
jgi:hypothetical protein